MTDEQINDARLIPALEALGKALHTTSDTMTITERTWLALATLPNGTVREIGIAAEVIAEQARNRLGVDELKRPDIAETGKKVRDAAERMREVFKGMAGSPRPADGPPAGNAAERFVARQADALDEYERADARERRGTP